MSWRLSQETNENLSHQNRGWGQACIEVVVKDLMSIPGTEKQVSIADVSTVAIEICSHNKVFNREQ